MIKENKIFVLVGLVAVLTIGGMIFWSTSKSGEDLKVGEELKIAEREMKTAENQNVFKHENPIFSFTYPKGFKAGSFPEGGGEVVLLQSDSGVLGLQVYLTFFGEEVVLTEEKLRKDLPEMEIKNTAKTKVGGVEALSFLSKNESLGETYEIWLIHKGFLYQIISYAGQKTLVDEILKTWQW